MTAPSAILPTASTCARVDKPKPTTSGTDMAARTRSMKAPKCGGSSVRLPVMPVMDTQYR